MADKTDLSLSADQRVVATEMLEAEKVIERLSATIPETETEKRLALAECEAWLAEAYDVIRPADTFFIRLKKKAWLYLTFQYTFGLDSAYQRLHKIRHAFCFLLPLAELSMIVQYLRADVIYVTDPERQARYDRKFDEISTQLYAGLTDEGAQRNACLRHELADLSRAVAYYRENVWHKVNLLRTRLSVTLIVLCALLIICYWLVPYAVGDHVSWATVGVLQVFGAVGGALSALLVRQSLDTQIAQYYVELTTLYLRPAIGAAAGFLLGLLHVLRVVTIVPSTDDVNRLYVALFVAFVGGFSERFFLSRVDALSSSKASRKSGS